MVREILAIGVNAYNDPRYVNLQGAHADAAAVLSFFANELPKERRFEVATLQEDPEVEEVKDYLESALDRQDDDSTFIFYFAGHGVSVGDEQFLLCRDASEASTEGEGSVCAGALDMEYMRRFSQRGKGNILFIYDVCRSAVENGKDDFGGASGFKDCTSEAPNPEEYGGSGLRFAVVSCGAGERSTDDGRFVAALLDEMRERLNAGESVCLDDALVQGTYDRLGKGGQRPEASGAPFDLAPACAASWKLRNSEVGANRSFDLASVKDSSGLAQTLILLTIAVLLVVAISLMMRNGAHDASTRDSNSLSEGFPGNKGIYIDEQRRTQESKANKISEMLLEHEELSRRLEDLKGRVGSEKAVELEKMLEKNKTLIDQLSHMRKKTYLTSDRLAIQATQLNNLRSQSYRLETSLAESQQESSNESKLIDELGRRFIRIPCGNFQMGNVLSASEIAKRWGGDEKNYADAPQHVVALTKDYYLCEYPVTRGEFAQFVAETGYKTMVEENGAALGINGDGEWNVVRGLTWRDPGFKQTKKDPVVCVCWYDAQKYVDWLNEKYGDKLPSGFQYALPTEAEWERACRSGTDTVFERRGRNRRA